MIVTFRQDGAEDLVWSDFKPGKLLSTEAEAIEKVSGQTYAEWQVALMKGSAAASRALVWVWRKRTDPTLRFRDVDFPMDDFGLDYDAEEKAKLREAIEADEDMTESDKALALAALGPVEDEPPVDGPGNDPQATESVAA